MQLIAAIGYVLGWLVVFAALVWALMVFMGAQA